MDGRVLVSTWVCSFRGRRARAGVDVHVLVHVLVDVDGWPAGFDKVAGSPDDSGVSYGPHIPAWNAVCERLGRAREDMLAQNAFAIDSSGALLARAWAPFGAEQEAVLAVAEWFATTRMPERKPHARHERGLHIVVVPFGGIYAVAATYEELPPTQVVVAFEPHRKPLLELLAALPPVDGPDAHGGLAAVPRTRRPG